MVQSGSPQEIVLNPADDYVSDFIKDINRGRVLEVGSVMDAKAPKNGPKIDIKTVVEDAMQQLVQADAKEAIVVSNGKSVGGISLGSMVTAIARKESISEGTSAYT